MENEKQVETRGFYEKCANLFKIESDYKPFPYRRRTRWNNRTAGNGRFEGHGLVRMFSSTLVIISLHTPKLSGQFKSGEEALEAIKEAISLA